MYYPSADIFPKPLASEDIIIFNWEQGDKQIGLKDKENGQIGVDKVIDKSNNKCNFCD